MFSWLLRLFGRDTTTDVYRPKERLIYSYSNGEKDIKVDPIVLYKEIMKVGPELAVAIQVAVSPSQDAVKAHDDSMVHIRRIFGIKPYAEGGLTETETAELLDNFLLWCDRLKKNVRNPPTSPPETSASTEPS